MLNNHKQSNSKSFILVISIVSFCVIFAWSQIALAQDQRDLVTPQSLILSNQIEQPASHTPTYSSYTKYETTFLPGMKLCTSSTTSSSQHTACQDAVIQGLSSNPTDFYQIKPSTIIENEVQPRGNLLQIKFDKRIRTSR